MTSTGRSSPCRSTGIYRQECAVPPVVHSQEICSLYRQYTCGDCLWRQSCSKIREGCVQNHTRQCVSGECGNRESRQQCFRRLLCESGYQRPGGCIHRYACVGCGQKAMVAFDVALSNADSERSVPRAEIVYDDENAGDNVSPECQVLLIHSDVPAVSGLAAERFGKSVRLTWPEPDRGGGVRDGDR